MSSLWMDNEKSGGRKLTLDSSRTWWLTMFLTFQRRRDCFLDLCESLATTAVAAYLILES